MPRVLPRQEQLVRAERMRALGLAELCLPKDATPKRLGEWLAKDVARPCVRNRIDFGGLGRLRALLEEASRSHSSVSIGVQ